jgi:hypothetical protein
MKGIIISDGTVLGDDGILYTLPFRGEGEVLVDSKKFNGIGCFQRQALAPLTGLTVIFSTVGEHGYNFVVVGVDEQ